MTEYVFCGWISLKVNRLGSRSCFHCFSLAVSRISVKVLYCKMMKKNRADHKTDEEVRNVITEVTFDFG